MMSLSSGQQPATALVFSRFESAQQQTDGPIASDFIPFSPETGFAVPGSGLPPAGLRGSFHTDDELADLLAAASEAGAAACAAAHGAQVSAALLLLTDCCSRLDAQRNALIQEAGAAICAIVLQLTAKLVGERIASDPKSLAGYVGRVMSSVEQPLHIRCHPQVAAVLGSAANAAVKIEQDANLPLDAFTIAVAGGVVEAGIQAQLGEIEASLRQTLTGAAADV